MRATDRSEATEPVSCRVLLQITPVVEAADLVHDFHLCLDAPPAEVWEWDEKSGGDIVEHRFAFRWVSLDDAGALLWPVQAMWVNTLRLSLQNR